MRYTHTHTHTHTHSQNLTTALEMMNVTLTLALSSRDPTWRRGDPVSRFCFFFCNREKWKPGPQWSRKQRQRRVMCADGGQAPGNRLVDVAGSFSASPDLPPWILRTVATPHDRCFIIPIITLNLFHVTSCLQSF